MDKDMTEVLRKAEVLIEALPYIQQFNRKIIVVKYGGSAMSNGELQKMEVAENVLSKVNKSLVTMVQELGVKAVGISGKDGGLLTVDKKYSDGKDIGFVGDIKEVNPKVL